MNQSVDPSPDSYSIATLLRLAADGELTPEQRARLDAHLAGHPEDGDRIAFERELRGACARACCPDCCAPEGLRERVLACCAEASIGDGLDARAGQTRDRSFWLRGVVARYSTMAALIALVAVVAFMIGRSSPPAAGNDGIVAPRMLAASLANFVRKEHNRCVEGGPNVGQKFFIRDAEVVPEEFELLIGRPVTLACLVKAQAEGLEFVDAGICHPPDGDALHLRFAPEGAAGEDEYVSLWVQQDSGKLEIEDGVTYTLGEGSDCVRFWRIDGVRYVLVCPDEARAPGAAFALASPAAIRSY